MSPVGSEFIRHESHQGHDARAIANALIHRGATRSQPRTPLQVVKLTYLCHGWMLGLYHRPMSIQPVLAWRHGPVIPDVYHMVKRYGRQPVPTPFQWPHGNFGELEDDLIGQVFEVYLGFSGVDLSMLTHAQGTPWHQIWYREGRNAPIPDTLIEKHFSEMADKQ